MSLDHGARRALRNHRALGPGDLSEVDCVTIALTERVWPTRKLAADAPGKLPVETELAEFSEICDRFAVMDFPGNPGACQKPIEPSFLSPTQIRHLHVLV